MKQSELRCPWGCKGEFTQIQNQYGEHFIEHVCEYLQRASYGGHNVLEGKVSTTKQGAMNNWNSWIKP